MQEFYFIFILEVSYGDSIAASQAWPPENGAGDPALYRDAPTRLARVGYVPPGGLLRVDAALAE